MIMIQENAFRDSMMADSKDYRRIRRAQRRIDVEKPKSQASMPTSIVARPTNSDTFSNIDNKKVPSWDLKSRLEVMEKMVNRSQARLAELDREKASLQATLGFKSSLTKTSVSNKSKKVPSWDLKGRLEVMEKMVNSSQARLTELQQEKASLQADEVKTSGRLIKTARRRAGTEAALVPGHRTPSTSTSSPEQSSKPLLESFKGLSFESKEEYPLIPKMKQKHEEIFKSVMQELGIDECHRKLEHLGVDKSNLESLEGVQQMEINVVDESLHRVKVMLDLENKWESLRVRKEAEHTAVMKQEITEEQDKLVKELYRLAVENNEKEVSEIKLLIEVGKIKSVLKVKNDKTNAFDGINDMKIFKKKEEERKKKEEDLEAKRIHHQELLKSVGLKWKARKRNQRDQDKRLGILEKQRLEEERLELERVERERQEKEKLRKEVVPECPLCLEEMGPGVAIWQCGAGHLVCGGCRGRARLCGECRQGGYTSRSRRLEQYRDKIMHILDIAPAQ